jgi:hypothetical protein
MRNIYAMLVRKPEENRDIVENKRIKPPKPKLYLKNIKNSVRTSKKTPHLTTTKINL